MIKNFTYVLIKLILKFFLKLKFIKINRKKITFISYPDLADNSWYLFNYIHKNRNNLILIWLLNENLSENKKKNLIKINKTNKLLFFKKKSLTGVYHFLSSRIVFFTHNTYFFSQKNIGPILVNLWHGMPIKKIGFYRHKKPVNFYFNYIISTSSLYQKILSKAFSLKKKSVLNYGLPRNDILTNKKKISFKKKNLKLILWLPTFRKTNKFDKIHDSSNQHFLKEWSANLLSDLNKIAINYKILILIKIHYLDVFKKPRKKFSNIIFFTDDDLFKNKLDLHELISISDGLISDISSVIIDYILMKKPLGLTTNFLKDFRRGLIKDLNFFNNLNYLKIKTINDFKFFFKIVKKNQKMNIDPKNIFYSKKAVNSSKQISKYFNI